MAKLRSFRDRGERDPWLRFLAAGGLVLGCFLIGLAALGFLAGVAMLVDNRMPYGGLGLGAALVWSLGLLFSGVQSIALGSFLRLMIYVEENTRATAQALDRMAKEAEPKPAFDANAMFLT